MATGLRRAPSHRCGDWASAAREQCGGGAQGHRVQAAAASRRASAHDKQMFDLHTYEPPDFGGGYCGVGVQIHHPDEAATVLAVPDEVAVHPQPVVGGLVDGAVGPDVWSQPEAVDEVTPRALFSMLIVTPVLQPRARPTQPQPAHDTIEDILVQSKSQY
uniref:Uncharacterized protein n=1 Tax=Oryza glaberrima TaxID=4538 RepID=I1P0U7_ORYGL